MESLISRLDSSFVTNSSSPATPDYSPGDYGYPSPGDWDSDYDTGQD